LLRIAIYNISYIRGLFPEKYFNDKSVPALGYDQTQYLYAKSASQCDICKIKHSNILLFVTEMKIKKLMPMDAESRRLIDWMEKG
jgi:hypothetical protein